MDIAVIGSNNVDLITYINRMPREGETLEAPKFQMGCGGKGANQAIAAARLGSRVLMLTRVGNDVFAENTVANFAANGVDTAHVLRTEASSGVAPIFVDPEGRNSILIVKGANGLLSPEDVADAAEDLAKTKLIVLQLEIPLETVYAAIEFGNARGIPVLLNPAPAHPELDLDRIKGCDYFMPNESELALLTGMPVENPEQAEEAARSLLDAGIRNIVVTLGSRGALWINETHSRRPRRRRRHHGRRRRFHRLLQPLPRHRRRSQRGFGNLRPRSGGSRRRRIGPDRRVPLRGRLRDEAGNPNLVCHPRRIHGKSSLTGVEARSR